LADVIFRGASIKFKRLLIIKKWEELKSQYERPLALKSILTLLLGKCSTKPDFIILVGRY